MCVVGKVGAFFAIISAGGIVRVKLTLQGRTVLDSKMWVGMSINQSTPFDEIEIFGADGAIEFWAGAVPMTQQGTIAVRGANAIRCSKVPVMGETLLTGADLTRSAVRIRTDKEIFLGGAGVEGAGWRLPVGNYEEIPVAGSLYAYRQKPEIKISESVYVGTHTGKFKDTIDAGWVHISEDENLMLKWEFNYTPELWTVADDWVQHPDFPQGYVASFNMIKNPITKILYASIATFNGGAGYLNLYRSLDDGQSFESVTVLTWGADGQDQQISNSSTTQKMTIVGNILSINMSGVLIGYNLITGEQRNLSSGDNDQNGIKYAFGNLWFTSEDMQSISGTISGDFLYTIDGGKNWDPFGIQFTTVNAFNDGKYLLGVNTGGSRKATFSNDHGLSWYESDYRDDNGSRDYPSYFYDGLWLVFEGVELWGFQIVDGALVKTQANNTYSISNSDDKPHIMDGGKIYRFTSTKTVAGYIDVDEWQVSMTGDTSPALVEIMELLN